jgi:hypothetical protein
MVSLSGCYQFILRVKSSATGAGEMLRLPLWCRTPQRQLKILRLRLAAQKAPPLCVKAAGLVMFRISN